MDAVVTVDTASHLVDPAESNAAGSDPVDARSADTASSVAANSVSVAGWTLLSRATGFVRVALISAILGPTFFGNLFQAANTLPWYVYELAIGSLLASLLVPPLVQLGTHEDQRRMANGFFGVMVTVFAAISVGVALASPLLASVLGRSSDDPGAFRDVAIPLLALTAPQLLGYGVIATAAAVQNARGRYAFPAGTPAVENLIVIAALVIYAFRYGTGTELADITTGHWLLLALGSTGGVLVHAALQWGAAARLGVPLVPRVRAGWRDPDVRHVVRLAVPSLGSALLNGARLVLIVVATSQIAGGYVALQLGLSVLNLAVALGAKPAITAALPVLARQAGDGSSFRATYEHALRLAAVVVIPATVGLLLLSGIVANGNAFGEMNTADGRQLLFYAVIGTAAGIIGESLYQVSVGAAFALRTAIPALAGMATRFVLTAAGIAVAMTQLDGPTRLLGAALAMSVADVVGGWVVHRKVVARLPQSDGSLRLGLPRTLVAAGLAFVPMAMIVDVIGDAAPTPPSATLVGGGLGGLGFLLFLLIRSQLGHFELASLLPRRTRELATTEADVIAPVADSGYGPSGYGPSGMRIAAFGLISAAVLGVAIGQLGVIAAGGFLGLLLVVAVWQHPPIGAWVLIAAAPFIVGFDRGQALPLLRPNEAVFLLVVAVLGMRGFVYGFAKDWRWHRVDLVVALVVFTGSILPLMVQFGRLRPLTIDDFFYAIALWKFGGIYAVVRSVIRTPKQVKICLWLSVTAASILGIIAVADSLNLFGTAYTLANYFPPGEGPINDGRGGATIGNPIGLGGYMAVNVCIALGLLMRRAEPVHRAVLRLDRSAIGALAALGCCGFGVVGAGQFGPVLSLTAGALAWGLATRNLGRMILAGVAFAVLSGALLWPVVNRRLEGLDGPGINSVEKRDALATDDPNAALREINPGSSWAVRRYNLEFYFIPEFKDPWNIVFGVTPQARVDAPERFREYIWIESGHLWLLWTGGVPFLIAFGALLFVGMRTTYRLQQVRAGPLGVASAAAFAGLVVVAIGQTFDPYITLRGVADILWPVLALGVMPWPQRETLT